MSFFFVSVISLIKCLLNIYFQYFCILLMYVLFVRHLIILNYLLNIFILLFVLWILLSFSTYVLSIWYVLPIRYLLLCIYYSISLSMSTFNISIYVLSIRCLYICPTYSISSSLHYLLDISFYVPSIRYFLLFLFIRYLLFWTIYSMFFRYLL